MNEINCTVGIILTRDDLKYFCCLALSNNRIDMSFYAWPNEYSDEGLYLTEQEVIESDELVPGMQLEFFMAIDLLKNKGE